MGLYAVTGAASGIGAAIVDALRQRGDEVVTVDIRNADINADLSTPEGCQQAISSIRGRAASSGLQGFVPCAGVGPQTNPQSLIPQINFFGAVMMVEALRDLLTESRGAIVLVSSNSAPMVEYDAEYVQALLANDAAAASKRALEVDGQTCYGGSKFALTCWMRRNNASYAAAGIRMNAIAPGFTQTPLVQGGFDDPRYKQALTDFVNSIPIGRPGVPADQAQVVAFLLSDAASFVSGSVLFVDGGHDALFRPDRF